jgi:hypothetical protein
LENTLINHVAWSHNATVVAALLGEFHRMVSVNLLVT